MDVSLKNLPGYLELIHRFLVNNGKSYIFPSLTMAMEDILADIAKDTNNLKKYEDVDCIIWSKKILAVLEKNKEIYTLSYCFENVLGKRVMVYKKIPVPEFKEPLGLKLLRKPHSPNAQPAPSTDNTNTVMSSFKTTCLNGTLKFVKNDNQLILQYPDISTEQADFIKHMISQCLSPKDLSATPGGRGIFDPLAEALRIYSTKYDFKLNNAVPVKDDMKRLFFEKIPKKTAVTKDFETLSISSNSSQDSVEYQQTFTQLIQDLDNNFTIKTIREIKEFLMNKDEEIEFTNLTIPQELFLVQWKSVLISLEVLKLGDDVQDDLRKIKSLLMENKGVCKVETSLQNVSPTQRTVTFTKKRKQNPAVALDYPDLLSNCNLRTSPEKMNKRIQKFFNATNSLSDKWIEKSLKELKNFIQDDAQAHLVIPNAKDSQVAFLSKWKTFLGMKDVIEFYNTDIQRLLIDIKTNMAEKMAPWKIACSSSKRKMDFTRDVTFMKYPDYNDDTRSQAPTKTAPKADTKKAEIAPKSNTIKVEKSTKVVEPVKSNKGIPKSTSVTSLPVQKVPVLSERGRPKSATVAPGQQAKAKLIQALSQPLVSEKGLKMMKSMGWDGGALGLRGEGIVEPIALPLDLKKGAGLGCEKEQIKRSKLPLTKPVMTNLPVNISRVIPPCNMSKMDFKMGILHTILNMVQEATPATELPFNKKLTQKNWSFIRHAVISFNQKTKYMHNEPIFRDLGLRIVDKMSKNKYIITACWGVSKTNVLFALSKAIYEPSDLNSNEWCSVVNFDKPKISDNKSVNSNFDKPKISDNKSVNSNFDKPKISDKSVNTLSSNVIVTGDAFRYYVLAQILEFCDVPSKSLLTKEIVLKEAMKQKQMNYIKDVIFRLNKKSKASSVLDDETAVFSDIIDAMKQFTLHVDFPFVKRANENKKLIYKTIRFHKILNIPKTAKDTKRRTTFSSDTFDEKFMFDSQISIYNQNAPIPEQDVPKIVQDEPVIDLDAPKYADAPKVGQDPKHEHNEPKMHQDTPMYAQDVPKIAQDPKHDQNELKHDQDALKYDQDAPKIVQDAPEPDHNPQNHKQNAPKIVRNEPNNLIDGVDCICCLPDDITSNEENDEVKAVEYIFIEKETVESDIDGPIVTVTKDNEVTSNMTHDMNKKLTTIANLNDEIKNLSINDNIDIENLVERPEETIYGLDFENIESPIRNIFKHKNLCKRPISNSSTPDRACKKGRYEHYFKKISITPKNYPQNEITNEVAAKIQKSILGSIDYTDDLPLLQCHGIEDGALVYSCHTEKSLNFILNVIKSLDLLVTVSQEGEIVCHRMKVKIRSFIKESIDVIFDRLETYNINLDTRNWKVIDIERGRDFVIICMDVDENSYKMLFREKLTLYTGIDQAKFSLVWD